MQSASPAKVYFKEWTIVYKEEDMLAHEHSRAQAARKTHLNTSLLPQVEHACLASVQEVDNLGGRKNLHFSGTTSGAAILEVPVSAVQDRWRIAYDHKKRMLGESLMISAGCHHAASDNDRVPVNWNSTHVTLWQELLHRSKCSFLIDLTVRDEVSAWVALQQKIPFVGITQSEEHSKLLTARLEQLLFEAYLEPESTEYNAKLASCVAKRKPEDGSPDGPPAKKAKAGAKRKAKAKATQGKAKAKGKAKAAANNEADPGAAPAKKSKAAKVATNHSEVENSLESEESESDQDSEFAP